MLDQIRDTNSSSTPVRASGVFEEAAQIVRSASGPQRFEAARLSCARDRYTVAGEIGGAVRCPICGGPLA